MSNSTYLKIPKFSKLMSLNKSIGKSRDDWLDSGQMKVNISTRCWVYLNNSGLLKRIGETMRRRRLYMIGKCEQYSSDLKNVSTRYLERLRWRLPSTLEPEWARLMESDACRYEPTHQLMYCENLKISSSTWATHFLSLNNVQSDQATPVHGLNRKVCPPLYGEERELFLNTGLSFIVVRDPFQRLLSAYLVKATF